jgi:predicted RNase H-related nuclease YkuK (DUF458 family)
MFTSITYGKLTKEQVFMKILERIEQIKRNGYEYEIAVGTDSQTYRKTNIVRSIVLLEKTHGGIYFSSKKRIKRFNDLQPKIYAEVSETLTLADELRTFLKEKGFSTEEIIDNLVVDLDIGSNGLTCDFIQGITGWVKAYGFKFRLKPSSVAASRVSDKLSKRGADSTTIKPHIRPKDKRKKSKK